MIGGGNLRTPGLSLPMEIRADISALPTAGLAGEAWLYVGQPNVIRPPFAADRGPMAALIIRAIDQQAANARGAHFAEGDLLVGWHEHLTMLGAARPEGNSAPAGGRAEAAKGV